MSFPFFPPKYDKDNSADDAALVSETGRGSVFVFFLCNKYQFKPSTSATQETISHQPAPTPFRHDFPPVPSPSSNRRSKVASHSSCNKFQFDAVCDVFSQCAYFLVFWAHQQRHASSWFWEEKNAARDLPQTGVPFFYL